MRLAIIGAILAVLGLPSTLPHDHCENVLHKSIVSKSDNSAALVVSLRSIMQCINSMSRRVLLQDWQTSKGRKGIEPLIAPRRVETGATKIIKFPVEETLLKKEMVM